MPFKTLIKWGDKFGFDGFIIMKTATKRLTIACILLLILFCVYGAFIGAQKAQNFFNSAPLMVYWIFAAVLISASIMMFKKLKKPELLLMHIGFVLIILGSFWSSQKGHDIRAKVFGDYKPQRSQMIIYQNQSSDMIFEKSKNQNYKLPFTLRLNEFIVEYYEPRPIMPLPNGHQAPVGNFAITYHRPIKDYISKVDVLKSGQVVKSFDIEVNHPLNYGGFDFYQNSYDDKQHQYTVLQVVSNSGLNIVYIGYAAVCLGVFWYFWFIKLKQNLWK